MNKLIIIGNGFDLAHGLKTSYNDFILWYLNNCLDGIRNRLSFEDDLLTLTGPLKDPNFKIDSLIKFLEAKKRKDISVSYKSPFIKKIIEVSSEIGWVDIESLYYKELKSFYKIIERINENDNSGIYTRLENTNKCFFHLKNKLTEYLLTIDKTTKIFKEDIMSHFYEIVRKSNEDKGNVCVLNFNYTSTAELYTNNFLEVKPIKINYIHGKLDNYNNPIVFGYGDEMDEYYAKIEMLDSNEFLKNFKSFEYLKTDNYQNLEAFLADNSFHVYIMGHSCGLSDRVLLNSIFEHKYCQKIQIFYYEKNKNENDHFEKTQNISRHFSGAKKGIMRNRIITFPNSKPLVGFRPNQ